MLSKCQVLTVIILSSIICSCATMEPARQNAINKTQPREQRTEKLQNIQAWKVKGALGINDSKQAWNSSIYWQQYAKQTFNLQLFGPVGVGTLKIHGQPQRVSLTTSQNKTFSANDSETLLAQQTGWLIPISNLYYWIRGLPAPNSPASQQFDSYQHLTELKQQGWNVKFQRYTAVNGVDLPSKILIISNKLKIRLIISEWKINKI